MQIFIPYIGTFEYTKGLTLLKAGGGIDPATEVHNPFWVKFFFSSIYTVSFLSFNVSSILFPVVHIPV